MYLIIVRNVREELFRGKKTKLFRTFHHNRRYVNRQLTSLWLLLFGTGTTHISGVSSVYWHLDKRLKTAAAHAFNVLQCILSSPGTLWGAYISKYRLDVICRNDCISISLWQKMFFLNEAQISEVWGGENWDVFTREQKWRALVF